MRRIRATGRAADTAGGCLAFEDSTAGGLAYLIGSFPTADLAARIAARRASRDRPVNLRETGTKNPGALNAAKVLGAKWGLAVLAGDVLKGAIACAAGRRIGGGDGAYVAGIGSVWGHCLPLWSGFRGGKGVATSAGTSIVCFPAYMPFDLGLAGATAWLEGAGGHRDVHLVSRVHGRGDVLVQASSRQPLGPTGDRRTPRRPRR